VVFVNSISHNLNPRQLEAVNHLQGPLLIVAGAGAGKTKTITHRILKLIDSGVSPSSILAVTFTNKSAAEMLERVTKLLADSSSIPQPLRSEDKPFLSTFHSLCVHILRGHGGYLGLSKYFTILDRDDSLRHIKNAMKQLDINPKQFEPRKILNKISHYKGKGMTNIDYREEVLKHPFGNIISSLWDTYEVSITKEKALDFDDLLLKTVILFRRFPEVLKAYRDQWQYIHIDEYQDTNGIQYNLVQALAGGHKNICVVGDVDQSIYSWRGADFANLNRFEEDYPEAKVVLLEQNYRSTKNILTVANEIIKKNIQRKDKNLFTENTDGEKISLAATLDEKGEAGFIAEKCFELIRTGIPSESIAVLYRANFQSRAIEEALLKTGVPYQVLGTRFFERQEIKDILSYAKFALNDADLESFKRLSNVPPRGIGKVTFAKIAAGQADKLPAKARASYHEIISIIEKIREHVQSHSAGETIKYILSTSGIESMLKQSTEEDVERLENIKELVTIAEKYNHLSGEEGLHSLISEASLVSDQDTLGQAKTGVKIMTIHASKGLEFDTVFVTGLEQGLFPHQGLPGSNEDRDEEEERRLCYVAVTRAGRKLYLSYAQTRMIFGSRQVNMPSEFILDLPDELVEAETDTGDTYEVTNYLEF